MRLCFDAASNNCSAFNNETPHSKVLQRSAGGFPGVWLHNLIFKRIGNIEVEKEEKKSVCEEVKDKSGFLNENTAACMFHIYTHIFFLSSG